MRVLFLTTRFPVPPWRGDQVRAYHQLRLLAGRHRITLVTLAERPPPPAARHAVESWGVEVDVVPVGRAGAPPALARALVGDRRPLQTLLYLRRAAQRAVTARLAREPYDLVHAQLVRTGAYLPAAGPPLVVDFVDALSENMARRAQRSRGPMSWVAAWEARRVAAFERALVARAAACVVVAAEDARLIDATAVRVVPNGVDLERHRYVGAERDESRIVFFGNLGYFPNVDAAQWLATEIFPLIRRALPGAQLRLVGARPTPAIRRLAQRPGVSLAADVPDMPAEVTVARLALLPMRAGTGLQNKVLEAMAVGTPVVATPRAIAAIDAQPGVHVLTATDASGLAQAAIEIVRTPGLGRRLAQAARELVVARYDWTAAAAALEQVWQKAVAGRLERAEASDIPAP